MDTLFSLKIFCAIVETGSFTQAADRLDISTAQASKHINALEKRLQARLLNRTNRTVSLTEQGERYYQRCFAAVEMLDEAENDIAHHQTRPKGTLNIVAPLWFANPRFTTQIARYRSFFPEVALTLELKNREQEQLADAEEIALRVNADVEDGLIARLVCRIPFHFVAAPAYLAAHGTPASTADLAAHQGLLPSYTPLKGIRSFLNIQPQQWLKTAVRSNNTAMLHQLALAAQGIAFLPDWMTENDTAQGSLKILLPDLPAYSLPLYAVYRSRRYLAPKVRSFIDFLLEENAASPQG